MADEKREQSAAGIDVTVPNVARLYDYALGGKDNFAVDRELAGAGITQFLDLGTGLPSQNNEPISSPVAVLLVTA